AASLAGALRDVAAGKVPDGVDIVCTLTGHGLKDPEIAMRGALDHIVKVPAERAAIAELLTQKMA
ncbi:MAG: threonine synthase, partial [Algiphilus sp.]